MIWRPRNTPENVTAAPPTVVRLEPAGSSAGSRVALAHALICDGRYRDALTELEIALADNPEMADGQIAKGLALARLDRLPEAIEPLERALEQDDQWRLAAFGLAAVYLRLEHYDLALALVRQMLVRDSADAKVHALEGETLLAAGRQAEALPAFRRALAINPRLLLARRRVGELLGEAGNWEAARTEYLAALRFSPADGRVLQALAGASRQLGLTDEAADWHERALARGQITAEHFEGLAACRFEQRRLFDAFNAARSALTLRPQSAAAHRLLARIYSAQGRTTEAAHHDAAAEQLAEVTPSPALAESLPNPQATWIE